MYHVALPVSNNMSPLDNGGGGEEGGEGGRAPEAMPATLIHVGASLPGGGVSAPIMALSVGTGPGATAVRLDDDMALDELAASSAEAADATLVTLQSLVAQAQAAQERILAVRAAQRAAQAGGGGGGGAGSLPTRPAAGTRA